MMQQAAFIHPDQVKNDFQANIENSFMFNGKKTVIQSGWKVQYVRVKMWLNIVWIAFKMYRDPLETWKKLKALIENWNKYRNKNQFVKNVKIGNRYYLNMNAPGWPSLSFNRFIKHQILKSGENAAPGIHTLILAITKKCGFQCEHCFEWNELNKQEKLTRSDLQLIIHRFHELGISQVQLSGGEPLNRFNDLIYLLNNKEPGTDFWLYSSGYSLNAEKAKLLQQNGLTGVIISIDHHKASEHDKFRGIDNAWLHAQSAVSNALHEGLAVTLSCCVTRSYCTRENLDKYMQMSKDMGVAFVQMLEPRAVGHYEGKDVGLKKEEIEILEAFYENYSQDPDRRDYPILTYHSYHVRRAGCQGSARDYVYVDTNGFIQSCPFCMQKWFSALEDDLQTNLKKMKVIGCS
jgi:MoaA/NifB/PqqE/SkfB family radical SAM enzyme